jgi:hypothetical protein
VWSRGVKTCYGKLVQAKTPTEGFLKTVAEPDTTVGEGDTLCYVSGAAITLPTFRKLISITKNAYVFEGDSVASVAPLTTD